LTGFIPGLLQAGFRGLHRDFCSAGIVKFRRFAARNHHSQPGLVLQAMRGASVAAIASATAN